MSTYNIVRTAFVVAAVAAAGAAGYWWGGQRAVISHEGAGAPAATGSGKGERKILYYRNPMGLPDTSPTPKKDPMGMDYVPVYEDDAPAAGGSEIRISADRVQKLGVRTEPVTRRALGRAVRAAGRVEIDERRLTTITPKFEGYVEKLYINATGQYVGRGVPLFEAYSPELLATQREYAIAVQGLAKLQGADAASIDGMKRLADSALERLRNWDVSDEQIARLAAGGSPVRALTFRAPAAGHVIDRKATLGMRFMPGEMLYQIADLSTVWVLADVFEQDIGVLRPGNLAQVTINAYPGRKFPGRVSFVYPTLTEATRTVPVRIELANPGGLLKPAMFADVSIEIAADAPKLALPNSAVIDSGRRRVVLVQTGEGRFEPREVSLGARGQDYVEVLDGVREGETVVITANFLIDSESNLKAALGGLAAPAAATVSHRASGTVQDIDAKGNTLAVEHGPVPSLKWPAMTMEFSLANSALLQGLKPGAPIDFEFLERQPGEWVIVKIEPGKASSPVGKR